MSSARPVEAPRENIAVTAIWVSLAAALAAFVAGLFGLWLQRLLPERHTSDRSRDMIAAIVGLVSLLLALVLGTITGSAYAFYSNQKTELETIAARALQLDIALAEFGPETKEARADLKAGTQRVYHMFWGEKPLFDSDPGQLAPGAIESLKATDAGIAALEPRTPLQKQAAAAAVVDAGLIQNTRLSIALQLKSPVSWPLVTVVVLWSVLLFCGFGLLSRINATTIAALGFGAFAVGSALFLIIELSQPYTGLFRVPPGALEESIEEMGK
jgi:hypothetical protein